MMIPSACSTLATPRWYGTSRPDPENDTSRVAGVLAPAAAASRQRRKLQPWRPRMKVRPAFFVSCAAATHRGALGGRQWLRAFLNVRRAFSFSHEAEGVPRGTGDSFFALFRWRRKGGGNATRRKRREAVRAIPVAKSLRLVPTQDPASLGIPRGGSRLIEWACFRRWAGRAVV